MYPIQGHISLNFFVYDYSIVILYSSFHYLSILPSLCVNVCHVYQTKFHQIRLSIHGVKLIMLPGFSGEMRAAMHSSLKL